MKIATKHALDRYIERVLNIEKVQEFDFKKHGYDINKVLNDMIINSTISMNSIGNEAVIYHVYNDILIIEQSNKIITLYIVNSDFKRGTQAHAEYIKYNMQMLKMLEQKRLKARFSEDIKSEHIYKDRIKQYQQLLFENDLYKLDECK